MTSDLMSAVIGRLADQTAAFLSLLLLASAAHKLVDRRRLANSAGALTGLPAATGPLLLLGAGVGELAAGLALWAPSLRAGAALLAGGLWGVYLLAILRAVAAGRRDLDCGCAFGRSRRSPALGGYEIVRNLVLCALAAALVVVANLPVAVAAGPLDLPAGLALFVLYLAIEQASANPFRTLRA